jgi:hypothetical protein
MTGRDAMRRWVLLACLLPVGAVLAGCGTAMFTHDRGSLESPGEAPSDGQYVLYESLNPTPLKEPIDLKKGDRLGFRTAETGRIIAVAGDSEWTYEDAPLVWRRK